MNSITPGEILNEEFLIPLNITQYKLAKEINVPAIRIHAIINGKRAITPDTALRLAKYFSNTPQFWLNLQTQYELAQKSKSMKKELDTKVLVCERVIHPKKRKAS